MLRCRGLAIAICSYGKRSLSISWPFFLCLFVGNVPMFHLASFSRGRDMRHRNAPTWLRGPHNSWAHRAAVRTTPCVLADRTVLHIKLVPTDCSMVDSPCPDVASHISLAKWTPVNDAFLFNNTILNRKFVPTDCSMVYLPCRHVTSYMPIASGTNVVILFRTGASFLDLEIVTACPAVIDLACSYSTVYRLLAMWTYVLENLAFGHGFCCLRWPHRPLPSVAVVLLAMYLRTFSLSSVAVLLSAGPSVVISVPFSCLRWQMHMTRVFWSIRLGGIHRKPLLL